MPRRFITREDVTAEAKDGVLEVGPNDVITQAAEDIAQRRNIQIRRSGGEAPTPRPKFDAPSPFASPAKTPRRGDTESAHVIIAAVGRNRPRVLAEITTRLADLEANILDISQTIVREYFSLLLIADTSRITGDFRDFKEQLEKLSSTGDYQLTVQHESVFRAMHRI